MPRPPQWRGERPTQEWTQADEMRYLETCRRAAEAATGGPAEAAFRAAHPDTFSPRDLVLAHRHLRPAGPVGANVDGSDWPVVGQAVHAVVVVAARRQIARFLSFVDVEGCVKELPRTAPTAKASAVAAGAASGDDVRLQLVMGRQLRLSTHDDDATHALIKSVRAGCILGVSGFPQRNRGAHEDLDVLELICQSATILHEPPPRLPGMWPARDGVAIGEPRRNPRQRKPRGRKALTKSIEAQGDYAARHMLVPVLTALVNELLVLQPAAPEEWLAQQLGGLGDSFALVLPSVRGEPPKDEQLPVLARPVETQRLVLAETAAECEAAAALMLAELAGQERCGAAVGLDTEWPPGSDRAVLLQLASEKHCVLLRLGLLDQAGAATACGPGSSLAQLLATPTFYLSGVGVTKDAQLLAEQYCLSLTGVVELAPLARQKGAGLRALCRSVLRCELPKVHEIRCGDWLAEPLSADQITYAALDAEAGRQLLRAVCHDEYAGEEGKALHSRCSPVAKDVLP